MGGELLAEFIEDARDHLQNANQCLLRLENDHTRMDDLNGLLRHLHTIKGNAGFLDQMRLYELLHRAESVLQTVREQDCAYCPPGLIDIEFSVLDMVGDILDRLELGQNGEVQGFKKLVEALENMEIELEAHTADEGYEEDSSSIAPPVTCSAGEKPLLPESADDYTPLNRIGTMLDGFRKTYFSGNQTGNVDFNRVILEMNSIREEIDSYLSERSLRAVDLIITFLTQGVDCNSGLMNSPWEFLEKLVINLADWIKIEDQLDSKKPGPIVMNVRQDSLSINEGHDFIQMVEDLKDNSMDGMIFDLRQCHTLHTLEIGVLMSAFWHIQHPDRIILVLDKELQGGLVRVLKVMGLDKLYQLSFSIEEARDKLTAS